MSDGGASYYVRTDSVYGAFTDIFGSEPPPGRIPALRGSRHSPAPSGGSQGALQATPPSPATPSGATTNPPFVVPTTPSTFAPVAGSPFYVPQAPGPLAMPVPSTTPASPSVQRAPSSGPAPPVSSSTSVPVVPRSQTSSVPPGTPMAQVVPTTPTHGSVAGGAVPVAPVSQPMPPQPQQVTRSVSQVWTGLKKQVMPQRSASASTSHLALGQRQNVTRGGRAIPTRASDIGAFAHADDDSSNALDEYPAPSRKASSSTISSLTGTQRSTIVTTSRREPLVYPALLSKVAAAFRERITPLQGDRTKNELTYKYAFTGQEAVDVIAYIIKTPDRNLALLLGRSLDAQKFFHDVTYDNRLRDAATEVYQFSNEENRDSHRTSPGINGGNISSQRLVGPPPSAQPSKTPNGVFTLLAECYSPTCTRERLCYSIACPRRLEQLARLNMKLDPGLMLSNQQETVLSWADEEKEENKLWSTSVPPEVLEQTPKEEQKRQEVICEFIYTERNFVKDLEYLREYYIKPLRRSNVIMPEGRRDKFVRAVFLNILEIHQLVLKFAEALTKRQQQAPVVRQLADIVLEFAPRFEPFMRYGAAQMYAKFELERERATNPAFARFVAEVERLPESRQLELHGYLSKPTTRLARYPLLLDNVLKHTQPDNPDHTNIPAAVTQIREWLTQLNAETGKAENRLQLYQLNRSLTFRPGEYVDLHLSDERRKIVYKGLLNKRPGQSEGTVQVVLFDNTLLFAKRKSAGDGREVLRVNSKPIPLELLQLAESDEIAARRKASHMIRTTVTRHNDMVSYPLTFQHLGRRGYVVTLYADSFQARKTWAMTILKQRDAQRALADIYSRHVLQASTPFKVHCAKPMDGGRKLLYGSERGIYLSEISFAEGDSSKPFCTAPQLVVQMPGTVSQLDALDKYGILLVLCDKVISALPLDCLEAGADPAANSRRVKQIAGQATFYKVDECLGRTLLSVVKSSGMSATIRILEPANPMASSQKRPPLRRLLTAGQGQMQSDGFKMFKPAIEVPSATMTLAYLRSHLCLGCARGFELLDLESLKFESLLDPADTSLDFVIKRESLRPISLYRIGREFLVNYSDFSFFINSNGWRSRPDWMIQWECVPQNIVLSYPYLVAFDSSFIEIRNMDAELLHVISGDNIRFLHESTHDILYVHENDRGRDEVVSLNFWEKQRRTDL